MYLTTYCCVSSKAKSVPPTSNFDFGSQTLYVVCRSMSLQLSLCGEKKRFKDFANVIRSTTLPSFTIANLIVDLQTANNSSSICGSFIVQLHLSHTNRMVKNSFILTLRCSSVYIFLLALATICVTKSLLLLLLSYISSLYVLYHLYILFCHYRAWISASYTALNII
jgi:hypothetical protein